MYIYIPKVLLLLLYFFAIQLLFATTFQRLPLSVSPGQPLSGLSASLSSFQSGLGGKEKSPNTQTTTFFVVAMTCLIMTESDGRSEGDILLEIPLRPALK